MFKHATPVPSATNVMQYVSEDQTVNAAMEILANRMVKPGPKIDKPSEAKKYLQLQMAALPYETFWAVFMDFQYRVLAVEELFRGTLTQTAVHTREVVKRALELNAAYMIVAHNHPSGEARPSEQDEVMTRNLGEVLAAVEVRLLDHYVIGGTNVFSFAENHALDGPQGGFIDELTKAIFGGKMPSGVQKIGINTTDKVGDVASDLIAHMGSAYKAPVPPQDAQVIDVEDRAGREAFRAMVEEVIRR